MGLKKWKGLERLKTIPKNQLLIGGLLGVLLLVIAMPTDRGSGTEPKETETVRKQGTQDEGTAKTESSNYESKIERRLEEILETVDGVGKVQVMVTLKDDGESVVEKDTSENSQESSEEGDGSKRTSSEKQFQKETVFFQNEGSSQSPFIAKSLTPGIEGILVVAEGGDNPTVTKNISDAVLALFSVEAHKIKVVKMNL